MGRVVKSLRTQITRFNPTVPPTPERWQATALQSGGSAAALDHGSVAMKRPGTLISALVKVVIQQRDGAESPAREQNHNWTVPE
jgi:hypothetical protein